MAGDSSTEPSLAVFTHDACLAHDPPAGEFEMPWTGRLAHRERHPDRPERIENVRSILRADLADLADLAWDEDPDPAGREALERVHDPDHLDDLRAASDRAAEEGSFRLTETTGVSAATWRAARHAAGAALAAVDHARAAGEVAYACVRPSGHHAAPAVADGFCYLNNAAVAAEAALADGADRVAILDWDVHHGNGTQTCFYDREDVLVLSIHNDHGPWDPEYHPETGKTDERGEGPGEGYTVNAPVHPGVGDEGYAFLAEHLIDPVVRAFDPDLVLCSAGGDAGHLDPLGRNLLTVPGFRELGRRVRGTADAVDADLALVQEGGYQPSHLGYAMLATLEGVLGVDSGVEDPMGWMAEDPDFLRGHLADVVAAQAEHWPVDPPGVSE